MTTIAYDGEFVAVDGRETQGNLICGDSVMKIYMRDGAWFIIAGCSDDCTRFVRDFSDRKETDIDAATEGFMIDASEIFYVSIYDGKFYKTRQCGQKFAIGSGASFALAAMDHGKSAVDAVEYAKTRDCKTGGEVKFIHVHSGSGNF
jgi:20S proteasome alpha/beta subunit